MPATKRARADRKVDEDDALKHSRPEADDAPAEETQRDGAPSLPDLNAGSLEPENWLALQQAIGNRAVGGLVERRRAGRPLPAATRDKMESSFGRDFGEVQIHSGPEVDQAALAMDAAAFTVDQDIYVHSALPGFDDPLGKQVLGEELAHVAQGVGTGDVNRVTDSGETAERKAQSAGKAAASGEPATVSAAPEAAGALARFDLGDDLKKIYDFVTGGTETAPRVEKPEKTELSDEEKDRLLSGALIPLSNLSTLLGNEQTAAQSGAPSAKGLTAIAQNANGISDFIASFSGPPAVQARIESAAQGVVSGRQALIGAIDPVQATIGSGNILSDIAGKIGALVSPPQPGNTPAPANAPPPAATPPAATAPANAAAPAAVDALTAAEADQIRFGAVEPLQSAGEQLKGEEPDLLAIVARLAGVSTMLRSFTKPAALVPQLHSQAMGVEGQVNRLLAIANGPQNAIGMAMSQWQQAIGVLQGLTTKAAGDGAPTKSEAPASSDDEDKNKPK